MIEEQATAATNGKNAIALIESLAWNVLALKHRIANSSSREERERYHEELGDVSGRIVRELGQVSQNKEDSPLPWEDMCCFRKTIMDDFLSYNV